MGGSNPLRSAASLFAIVFLFALYWRLGHTEVHTQLSNLHQYALAHANRPSSISSRTTGIETCEFCLLNPDDDLCQYGVDSVRISRAFEGSGVRVRRFLEKAIRGEEVRIGVIGASVSQGHGLWGKQIWWQRFFEDFVKQFPNAKVYDGTSPGMNSKFYSYCFESLLPRDLDLYLVELDINNEAKDETFNADDTLFRGLLGLPHQPAVMRVSVFALAFDDLVRGLPSSLFMSQFFDVPVISVRNFLLPHIIRHPDQAERFFSKDWKGETDFRHIGFDTHTALGDMVSIYMREKTCDTRRRMDSPERKIAAPWPSPDEVGGVPRLYPWGRFSPTFEADPVNPICFMLGSKNRHLDPIARLQVGNWRREEWNGKQAWTSSDVGARIAFEFTGTKIGVFFWTSNGAGYVVKPGKAGCWVDDSKHLGKTLDGFIASETAGSSWMTIQETLTYGQHTITCEILGDTSTDGHDFRVIGIASS